MNFDSLYKEYSDYKYELDRAAERSRRKSWNDADHVKVIRDASCDLSMESLVANATRVRYEVEKWKERNPESYENFLKIVRVYNNAALAGTTFSAILSAPETGGASLLIFGLGASLLAGIEVLADFIAEESADKIAQYCAKGDKAKESSYLKTCDFIIQFAAENGLIAAGRVKIAGYKKLDKIAQKHEARFTQREVGNVGKYGELTKGSPFHDDKQVHHIPSKKFMEKYGISRDDGLAIMMTKEQHDLTRTMRKAPTSNPPREELAKDLCDVRKIMKDDGTYTKEVNKKLLDGVDKFKAEFSNVFKKEKK